MANDYLQFEQRKRDHIELSLNESNQSAELNIFDSFSLRHEALPDLDFNELDLTHMRLGKTVKKPLLSVQ